MLKICLLGALLGVSASYCAVYIAEATYKHHHHHIEFAGTLEI